jgi:hypothetical protein
MAACRMRRKMVLDNDNDDEPVVAMTTTTTSAVGKLTRADWQPRKCATSLMKWMRLLPTKMILKETATRRSARPTLKTERSRSAASARAGALRRGARAPVRLPTVPARCCAMRGQIFDCWRSSRPQTVGYRLIDSNVSNSTIPDDVRPWIGDDNLGSACDSDEGRSTTTTNPMDVAAAERRRILVAALTGVEPVGAGRGYGCSVWLYRRRRADSAARFGRSAALDHGMPPWSTNKNVWGSLDLKKIVHFEDVPLSLWPHFEILQ